MLVKVGWAEMVVGMFSEYYRLAVRLALVILVAALLGTQLLPTVEMRDWRARVAERGEPVWAISALDFNPETYPALDLGLTFTPYGAERTWAHLTATNEELRSMRPAIETVRLWGILPLTKLVAVGESTSDVKARCAHISLSGAPCSLGAVSQSAIARFLEPGRIVLQSDGPELKPAFAVVDLDTADAALARIRPPSHIAPDQVHLGVSRSSLTVRAAWAAGVAPLLPQTQFASAFEASRTQGAHVERMSASIVEPAGKARRGDEGTAIVPFMPVLSDVSPDDPSLVTVTAVGDIMMGTNYPSSSWLNPELYDGVPVDHVLDPALVNVLRGSDVTFGNLEGVLFDGQAPAKDCGLCFAFRSPEHYAGVLADAGFDVVSLANNHSGDFGLQGRSATRGALERAGLAYAGLDTEGARTATLALPDGRKVGVIAFAPNSGTLSINDYPRAAELVGALKASSDLVVVSFHGGAEGTEFMHVPSAPEIFHGEDRGDVRRFARSMIRAGADLVVGHGPHVPRGLEVYNGRLIAYSLGNFWTYAGVRSWGVLGLGPVLQAKLTPDGRIAALRVVSTRQAGRGVPMLDPVGEARALVVDLTRRDFPETHALITGRARALAELGRGEGTPTPVKVSAPVNHTPGS